MKKLNLTKKHNIGNRYAAVVLAAGMSTRMGKNKMLLKLGEKTVLEWVIYHILKGGFEPEDICVVVSVDMFKRDINSLSIPEEVKVISNPKSHFGQSTSMKLGVENMIYRKGLFFFLGDQPFIHPDDILQLRKEANKKDDAIIVPITENGKKGNPTVFPKKFYDELLLVQGDIGGRDVMGNPANKVNLVCLYKSFIHFDLDTPEDYAQSKELFNKWIYFD